MKYKIGLLLTALWLLTGQAFGQGAPLRLETYGGVPDYNVTDNSAALNATIAASGSANNYSIFIDGPFDFKTAPAKITKFVNIYGVYGVSGMLRDYTGDFLVFSGGDTAHGNCNAVNDSSLHDLGLAALSGTSGDMIRLEATTVGCSASYIKLHDLNITYGGGTIGYTGIRLAGEPNNLSGGQGIRDTYIRDLHVFDPLPGGVQSCQIAIDNGVNIAVTNAWVNTNVCVTGGGTSLTDSNTVSIADSQILGTVSIDNSTGVVVNGGTMSYVTVASTVGYCRIAALVYGSVTNNDPYCTVH